MPLVRLLVLVVALAAVPAAAQRWREEHTRTFSERLLDAHNAERTRLGLPLLRWSDRLAGQAQAWADHQAYHGLYEHAEERHGAGENLWMGWTGTATPEQMIQAFIDERAYFRPGRFPDVSTTGDWHHVGHYTQLIWPDTEELGCAMAQGRGSEYLVCRYYPAGNVMTKRVP
ncbi:CAP domain-containing protein [Alteraurantiacibacter buctensis]|uniref:SCP-like extracellular n=1 Tax=Alteraurantiacibacter buctensis TaxID=1503981 RepID=A0A844Z2S6_9SPHN|nr:CAP domain-containing protein [Alteraurantiacibacter buctensis]MXO72193.1 SCP-like extracellular [Alteraurantiacibacter buctensis]